MAPESWVLNLGCSRNGVVAVVVSVATWIDKIW